MSSSAYAYVRLTIEKSTVVVLVGSSPIAAHICGNILS